MPENKYGKYIITEMKPKNEAPWIPVFKPEEMTTVLFLDNSVLKGACYVETAWFWPPMVARKELGDMHAHNYNEVLGFFGTDPEHPHDLQGEFEVTLEDEIHSVTKSCLLFIPKGLRHGSIGFTKLNAPVFHFACGTGGDYY